jgi:ABC-type polysaccharide/polyol phosphate export permease
MLQPLQRAIADIGAAFKLKGVWMALASEDIADSHRATLLGRLWPLLNYLLFTGIIIFIFDRTAPGVNFMAYVAAGYLVWQFISETLTQSASLFIREAGFIQGTVLPMSIYVLRQTMRTAIRSAYALIGAVPLILFSGVEINAAMLSIAPAILLLLVTAPAVAILFAFAGVFFRDFQHIVSNSMRLLMFITPIFWVRGDGSGLRGLLYHWNPLTHYIEILRQPVVSGVIPLNSWAIVLECTAGMSVAALLLLGKFNRRIVFWL